MSNAAFSEMSLRPSSRSCVERCLFRDEPTPEFQIVRVDALLEEAHRRAVAHGLCRWRTARRGTGLNGVANGVVEMKDCRVGKFERLLERIGVHRTPANGGA